MEHSPSSGSFVDDNVSVSTVSASLTSLLESNVCLKEGHLRPLQGPYN